MLVPGCEGCLDKKLTFLTGNFDRGGGAGVSCL